MNKTPFAVILFFFLCLFLYTKFAGPVPFSVNSVQTNKSDFFRVDGNADATAVPDTALLSLGVTKTATTVEAAQKDANTVANTITDELKKLGVEAKNIKTTNYNVTPDYDFSGGAQRIRGYTVSQTIEARIKPVDKANQAVDAATKSGANLVGGIQFVLDEETQKELEQKAQKEAIEKAKEKAQSLANATGLRLGKIVDVQVGTSQPPRMQTMAFDAKNEAMGGDTQLNPGENKVQVTVTLSYELQ